MFAQKNYNNKMMQNIRMLIRKHFYPWQYTWYSTLVIDTTLDIIAVLVKTVAFVEIIIKRLLQPI